MKEKIWKPVIGYEGLYEISEYGDVKSLNYRNRNQIKILKIYKTNKGYLTVSLTKNKKSKNIKVSKLVLSTFLGPSPSSKHECAHNDGIKENNHISNLRWVTSKENSEDQIRHGTKVYGEKCGASKLNKRSVHAIRKLSSIGWTNKDIASLFLVTSPNISYILTGKTWKQNETF